MGQHGASIVGQVKDVAMAFPTLGIMDGGIGPLPINPSVIGCRTLSIMNENILESMQRFGIEKIEGVLGRWEMAVHTISHKALTVIHMR